MSTPKKVDKAMGPREGIPKGFILIQEEDDEPKGTELKEVKLKRSSALTGARHLAKHELKSHKGAEYAIAFRYAAALDTGAGGTQYIAMPWDVSATADFSSAAALFAECKVKHARVSISSQSPGVNANVRSLWGIDYSVSNSAPASESAVLQLEGLKMHSTNLTTQTVVEANAGFMAWASTASPVPGPYAGLYGQFSASAAGSNSTGACNYLVEVLVIFRGRK
jgi:hypothetical protein